MTPNDLDDFDNQKEDAQRNLSGEMCVFPNCFFEAEIQSRIETWLLSKAAGLEFGFVLCVR